MRVWRNRLNAFCGDTSGVVAVIFALSLPMLVASAGVGVDLAQAYNVKMRLADALDKAALAGGSTTGSNEAVEDRVEAFFQANYPEEDLGLAYDLTVSVDADSIVTVSAKADVKATFMAIFGQDTITVEITSRVKRELAGVEVALVLDVTGSMAGSNIAALKTASTSFLNIMFSRIDDIDYLKIGIVPYSSSVNVGPYGLGEDKLGGYYGPAFVERPATDPYVSPASNIQYGGGTNDWRGCILERTSPNDTNDLSPTDGGMWGMYRYRSCGYSWQYNYWSGWQQVYSCSGSPNNGCPSAEIVPLTNDQEALQDAIDSLNANGNTYGNVGMVWGYHVITPTEPFTEGVALDDEEWSRTIIMMTDGDNVVSNTYSAYGPSPGLTATDLNNKFADVCDNIKADGITIYTITFESGINETTKGFYRDCASDVSKYYDAPGGAELLEAFEEIANQLSQLHIIQ